MYCIMRIEKRGASAFTGLQKEARRELLAGCYNNEVRLQDSNKNIALQDSQNWLRDARTLVQAAGAKERKNSILGIEGLYTASPEWFKGRNPEEMNLYFKQCLEFHSQHYGQVVSAIIHMDESTPHLHVMSVPLTADGRLSAREMVGNRTQMSKCQTMFYEDVGRAFGLERGQVHEQGELRQHISTQEHRARQNERIIQEQSATMDRLATGQAEACRNALATAEELYDCREEIDRLKEEKKNLQTVIKGLKKDCNRQQKKLQSITEQTKKALQEKRKLRAEEEQARREKVRVERELEGVADRLKRSEYTERLEKEYDAVCDQLDRLQGRSRGLSR